MSKDINAARYVYCVTWNESNARQLAIFGDIEPARDFADYIKASRGAGSILTTTPVYGEDFVAMVTGKQYATGETA